MLGVARIWGNDLVGRHAVDQTIRNARIILEQEPSAQGVDKFFVLNRIVDEVTLSTLKQMIQAAGKTYLEIPFVPDEYRALRTPYERMKYLTNVNGARNHALNEGFQQWPIVMPLDGNHVFRKDGLAGFLNLIDMNGADAAYACPCWRVLEGQNWESLEVLPSVKEAYRISTDKVVVGMRELSIAMQDFCDVEFNESLPYGVVDKVELLWRLGLAGPWDWWEPQIRRSAVARMSRYAGEVKIAGFTIRLPSYQEGDTGDNWWRGHARANAVRAFVEAVDLKFT